MSSVQRSSDGSFLPGAVNVNGPNYISPEGRAHISTLAVPTPALQEGLRRLYAKNIDVEQWLSAVGKGSGDLEDSDRLDDEEAMNAVLLSYRIDEEPKAPLPAQGFFDATDDTGWPLDMRAWIDRQPQLTKAEMRYQPDSSNAAMTLFQDDRTRLSFAAANNPKAVVKLRDRGQADPEKYEYEHGCYAVYNKRVKRSLCIDLQSTLYYKSAVCCVRFSYDGRYIALGGDRSSQVFELETRKRIAHLEYDAVSQYGDSYVRSLCFTRDGKHLVTGGDDQKLRVWEFLSETLKHCWAGHEGEIFSLDCGPNGRQIASAGGDRTVRLWDMRQGGMYHVYLVDDGVTSVAISADGRFVAAGAQNRTIHIWDLHSGYVIQRLGGVDGHRQSVYGLSFHPKGHILTTASLDMTLKVWEIPTINHRGIQSRREIAQSGRCIRTLEGHQDYVLSVATTQDGSWIISGSRDKCLRVWNADTGDLQLTCSGHTDTVISVAASPTTNLVATAGRDMRARIWRLNSYSA